MNPFGSDLPPGSSIREIDHAAGAYNEPCLGCSDIYQACELNEDGLCEKCVRKEENENQEKEETKA